MCDRFPCATTNPEASSGLVSLLSDRGKATGRLDGEPYDAQRVLAAGPHLYSPDAREGNGRLVVVWARAAERGFTPFATTSTDCKALPCVKRAHGDVPPAEEPAGGRQSVF